MTFASARGAERRRSREGPNEEGALSVGDPSGEGSYAASRAPVVGSRRQRRATWEANEETTIA